jgi:hypothetical protein
MPTCIDWLMHNVMKRKDVLNSREFQSYSFRIEVRQARKIAGHHSIISLFVGCKLMLFLQLMSVIDLFERSSKIK